MLQEEKILDAKDVMDENIPLPLCPEDCVCLECVKERKESYDGSTEQALNDLEKDHYLAHRFDYE